MRILTWKCFTTFISMLALQLSLESIAYTQDGSRTIDPSVFTKNRPFSTAGGGVLDGSATARPQTNRSKKRTYRIADSSRKRPQQQGTSGTVIEQLGITFWKLRPASSSDRGARMLVRKGQTAEWIPERINADTPLREGDLVRISIESPKSGYIYILNRDQFADGSMGNPILIFPLAGRLDDNRVKAGRLIDIPAQEDQPNYFTAEPSRRDQTGEVLTFIVTTTPLPLPMSYEPLQIPLSDFKKWENMWSVLVERFEMEAGAGETWSIEEQQASLNKGGRQLTRNDPAPQTLYQVRTKARGAMMVTVPLRYVR